jgi:hypothetical protein
MPEPETLFRRRGLGDDHVKNLPIVLDNAHKLPKRLAPAHPDQRDIKNSDSYTDGLKTDFLVLSVRGGLP